jgi:preprotein translocase subunit SecF
MIVAAIGILLYITWTFRRLASSVRYGICAIIALTHDAVVVVGVFSLLRLEVNSMFIIAILTVIGYSVNNTIVLFDRIRENRTRDFSISFDLIVNMSLAGTLGRSLNTSLTTLFVLLALFLFGGPTISNFVLALIVGVVAGTYSSLFIASQILVSWERGELGRLVNWIPIPPFRRE